MNVKPGDLAICIKGRHEGVIGTVGRMLCLWDECGGVRITASILREYHPVWEFTASKEFVLANGEKFYVGPFPDAWLRPVSGLPDEQHTEEHNKLEA